MRDRVRVVLLLEESLIPLSLRGVVFAHHENYGGMAAAADWICQISSRVQVKLSKVSRPSMQSCESISAGEI